jgi:hypothetical protein
VRGRSRRQRPAGPQTRRASRGGTPADPSWPSCGTLVDRAVVGGPQTAQSQLLELIERTATDELMITSHVADAAVRARGLEHVARAFELQPAVATIT